jgi:hypothetical protein
MSKLQTASMCICHDRSKAAFWSFYACTFAIIGLKQLVGPFFRLSQPAGKSLGTLMYPALVETFYSWLSAKAESNYSRRNFPIKHSPHDFVVIARVRYGIVPILSFIVVQVDLIPKKIPRLSAEAIAMGREPMSSAGCIYIVIDTSNVINLGKVVYNV